MPLALLGWSALFGAGGYFVEKSGDAVEQTSNATIKMALVGAGVYLVLKKMKAI